MTWRDAAERCLSVTQVRVVLEWKGAIADAHTLYLERKEKGKKNYSNLSGV